MCLNRAAGKCCFIKNMERMKMSENLKKVLEYFVSNPEYIDKIAEINEKYPDRDENVAQIIALAKEAGFELTEEDVNIPEDVSVDELNSVAGGRIIDDYGHSSCRCYVGGGGTADEWQKTCACVGYGMGLFTEKGKERFGRNRMAFCCPVMLGNV